MKIAIMGGAGFIGSHVAKAYLDAGHDVLIFDTLVHSERSAIDARARLYDIDIRDSQLQNILQRERPDIVSYHVARSTGSELPWEERSLLDADVHVRGLLNVLDSCVAASVSKCIFASGGNDLYEHGEYRNYDHGETTGSGKATLFVANEDTPLCPQKPSAITKVAGEGYIRYYTRQYGLPHTILRYADVYGETEIEHAHHPLTSLARVVLRRERPVMREAAESVRDHLFIDDVVQANQLALTRGRNSTLHISSGRGYSNQELFRAVAATLGGEREPLYLASSLLRATSCVLDNTQASLALGWRPVVDLATGVRRAIERLCLAQGWAIPEEMEAMASSIKGTNELYLVGAVAGS